ncbi:MAG: DNA polymerase beta superfamily protein [Clostridium sp.]|uniref:DNA polymerase beta superfamily protein n=1 Tax=Clostridium sp. TaxID=1506 RepID=UPI003F323D98
MDFKEIIKKNEYDFLRNEKSLGNNIILLAPAGSYAYGTNVSNNNHVSDIDIRGVYLNSKEELLLMDCEEKPYENRELDVVLYPLKQIIKLLRACNPNTIELLGLKEDRYIYLSKEGKMLLDNRELFLSKRAYASFGGYAVQQLRRLQNALARDSYPQGEKEEHIKKSIEKQMLTFNDRYKEFGDGFINLEVEESKKIDLEKEILIDVNLKAYPLRDFKNIYSEMNQIIRDYDKLNKRNSKKDETHLLKHAMHLIRLLLMGNEILSGKGINTYRENDREFLLNIRNGKYSYEEIFSFVDKFEEEFKYAYIHTELNEKEDTKRINELVMEINKGILKR